MELWNTWLSLVNQLRAACSRKRTFFWLVTLLIGFTIKFDALGVTSLCRGVGLLSTYYTCTLNFFHSTSIDVEQLKTLWVQLIFKYFGGIIYINGRCLVVGDGIKVGKEGRKMPGVKWLHQDSDSNSKAAYIMGHSIQTVALLAQGLKTTFAIPLTSQIHEGIRFNCRDSRTLLDKMFELLVALKLPEKFYYIADKYYCSGRFMKQLIAAGIEMVTLMKKNAVAYYLPEASIEPKRGRHKKYGSAVKLFALFDTLTVFKQAIMPGQTGVMIEYAVVYLLWRPLGRVVQFVYVKHPEKGNMIAMSTDLSLAPLDVILCYSLRFKIEVFFKQAVHQVSVFMYRFWLKIMKPRKRGEGEQLIHFAPKYFKDKVANKLRAYHLFMQLGLIAQGLLQYLSMYQYRLVWDNFGTWLRTIRPNTLPSEKVVSLAMARTYVEFLVDATKHAIFKKFLRRRIDFGQLAAFPAQQKEAA